MWWTSSCGRVELQMTKAEAAACSHQGECDVDVQGLSEKPKIARQLAKIEPAKLRLELRELGCWDSAELADHKQNLQRVLWIAACDIAEGK